MAAQLCCLCFEICENFSNTSELVKFDHRTIAQILEQHVLSKLDINVEKCNVICYSCWIQVYKFHQFYRSLENIHRKNTEGRQKNIKSELEILSSVEYSPKHTLNTASNNGAPQLIESIKFEANVETEICHEILTKSEKQSLKVLHKTVEELKPFTLDSTNFELNKYHIINEPILYSDDDDNDAMSCNRSSCSSEQENILKSFKEISMSSRFLNNDNRPKKQQYSNICENDQLVRKYIAMNCDLCEFIAVTFKLLREHFRVLHKNVKKPYVKCCERKLIKPSLIVEHARYHEDPDYFKCDDCGKVLTSSKNLREHWITQHISLEQCQHKCDQCTNRFATPLLLKLHKATHIKSPDDGKLIKSMNEKTAIHLNIPRIKCPRIDCDSWHKDEKNLKMHLYRHHDIKKKFTCSDCGKQFGTKSNLDNHIASCHTKATYKCDICKKSLKQKRSLVEHMAQHTGKPLYSCPFCPKTFNTSSTLYSHKKRLHPVEWDNCRKSNISI